MEVLGDILRGGIAKAERGRRRRARRPHRERRGDQVRHGGDRPGASRAHLAQRRRAPGRRPRAHARRSARASSRRRASAAPARPRTTPPRVASMLALNAAAARALRAFTVHACTDVTRLLTPRPRLRDGARQRRAPGARRSRLACRSYPAPARSPSADGSTGGCRRNRDWLGDRVESRRTFRRSDRDRLRPADVRRPPGRLPPARPPTRAVAAIRAAGGSPPPSHRSVASTDAPGRRPGWSLRTRGSRGGRCT